MIACIGRALFWLLCAMTAPRPPVPDLRRLDPLTAEEIAEHLRDGVEPWRVDERSIDGGWCGSEWPRLWPPRQHIPAAARPCWACGNPAGFHTEHLPCSNVPPFKRDSPTLPDGSPYRRTT